MPEGNYSYQVMIGRGRAAGMLKKEIALINITLIIVKSFLLCKIELIIVKNNHFYQVN